MMEEDPLIPLVHVWNNAAFDSSSSSSASAWHAHATPARLTARGDKENRRPQLEDVDAEIDHIEAEILRLSSRLHHLRTSRGLDTQREPPPPPAAAKAQPQPRPRARGLSLGPLDVACAANPTLLVPDKQQPPPAAAQRMKPATKQQHQAPTAAARGRGLSLGPLDIAAPNPTTKLPSPRQPQQQQQPQVGAASRILKPIKEPPVQRRRGVSLGPMEIQHGISGKPAAATRAKPFPNKLNAIREEGQPSRQPAVVPAKLWPSSNKAKQPLDGKQGVAAAPSRAKARSSSMSPRSRRQSIARLTTNTRGGVAAFGASSKVADELTPKGVTNHPISSASTCRRPSGSSKVRVVPSRYSLMPGASLGAGTQERRRKDSLPGSVPAILDAGQSEETRATPATEPLDDDTSPESIDKVAELLPRIRTMPPPDETPRDSGCAKRAADLVGKRSFFTAAAGDSSSMSSYQARVLEADEEPEEAAAAEALGNDGEQQE